MEELLMKGLIGKLGFEWGEPVFFLAMVFCIVVPYLLGSVNFAVIFSKTMHHDDVREHGSGNAGSTNMLRTYGIKAAALTFAGDILKGVISTLLGFLILPYYTGFAYISALCCMLGHAFPLQYQFKGGKGFLVCLSTMYVIDWRVGLVATGIMVILLLITKYMSLSTTLAMLLCPILLIPFGASVPVILMALACAVFMAVRHNENFKRLIKGTESKFTLKGKK